jgi:flagellar hook protein FlgE
MSFYTGLSGLQASSKNLDIIGNNIANSNTVGMKASRAEFADMVAMSLGAGGNGGNNGIGVQVTNVAQQFTQGDIKITGNGLDIAINGAGFMQVSRPDGSIAYSRDGQLKLDKDGNILTNTGSNVMGYPTDIDGNRTSTTPQKLSIPTTAPIPAKVTSTVRAQFNLDARAKTATQATAAGLSPDARSKYGTSVNVYDAQGTASPLNLYFVKKDGAINQWDVFTDLTSTTPVSTIEFDAVGKATAPLVGGQLAFSIPGSTIASLNPNETSGKFPAALTVTLDGATQYGVNFGVSDLAQDGYTTGEFAGLNIDKQGIISTRYTNGQSQQSGGQIALADFRNVQGLTPMGAGEYVETMSSGPVMLGQAMQGRYGELRAAALEQSNVDLTGELVQMMTAQRDYQANAQTIKTQDQIMSTLVNLR